MTRASWLQISPHLPGLAELPQLVRPLPPQRLKHWHSFDPGPEPFLPSSETNPKICQGRRRRKGTPAGRGAGWPCTIELEHETSILIDAVPDFPMVLYPYPLSDQQDCRSSKPIPIQKGKTKEIQLPPPAWFPESPDSKVDCFTKRCK